MSSSLFIRPHVNVESKARLTDENALTVEKCRIENDAVFKRRCVKTLAYYFAVTLIFETFAAFFESESRETNFSFSFLQTGPSIPDDEEGHLAYKLGDVIEHEFMKCNRAASIEKTSFCLRRTAKLSAKGLAWKTTF